MFDTVMDVLPWIALVLLSLGYWSQVWKTHVHREVRDLSMISYVLMAIGFVIMGLRAFHEGSVIFLTKQFATLIPVAVLIGQIYYHRDDRWHDDADELCSSCNEELEPQWSFCPYCGVNASDPDESSLSTSVEKAPNIRAA
ncbi:MAG: zinc ribbon domain-containing protein [Deltaproteobacteria bacterium]|nr:MAG: zinc ribbon domain-containing protein [Deltaproteobacteria bacterium]